MGGKDKMKTKKIVVGGVAVLSFVILSAHKCKSRGYVAACKSKRVFSLSSDG
jgi:hypothetical protein